MSEHRTTSRVLDILELLYKNNNGLTFTEICTLMDMPKSSLHPLLTTLHKRNYIHYGKENSKYSIGQQLFVLGNGYETDLTQLIQTELDNLSKSVGENVYLGVLSGTEVIYLQKSQFAKSHIQTSTKIGKRLKAYATGFGKALLSQFSEQQLKELYKNGLQELTPNTITDLDVLYKQCQEIKQSGFSYEKEESTPEIQCIGVAIMHGNTYMAGISVVVPVYRYTNEIEEQIKEKISIAKQAIEGHIAQNPSGWIY